MTLQRLGEVQHHRNNKGPALAGPKGSVRSLDAVCFIGAFTVR